MGFSPHPFFNPLFSFLGQGQEVEAGNCTSLQTVAGFIQNGTGQQQLFLSQRNVRTTGASFVLREESCEGRLEVSLGLRRARDPRDRAHLNPTRGVPPHLADRKGSWSSAGVGPEVRPHRWVAALP